jgi:tetratricopeptide (TPR) repeat protein
VIAALLLGLALAATQERQPEVRSRLLDPPPPGPSEWYRKLVEQYRSGDREAAVAEEAPPEKFLYEINGLARLVAAARRAPSGPVRHGLDTFSIPAAVMLHTERAFALFDRYDPAAEAELDLPPRLIRLMDDAARNPFEPRWVRATALRLSQEGQWALGLALLEPALKRYPDDPLLLLAKGATIESRARLDPGSTVEYQRVTSGGLRRGEMKSGSREVREQLSRAEACYRRALYVRPELIHARVRLGRVLQLLGRYPASVSELQAVLAAAGPTNVPEARDLYLAHLFIGYAHEQAGLLDRAAAAYEKAVRAFPDGQAGAVALSHARHRLGLGPASVEALQAGLSRAGRRLVVDAWWPYLAGQCEDTAALYAGLLEELTP